MYFELLAKKIFDYLKFIPWALGLGPRFIPRRLKILLVRSLEIKKDPAGQKVMDRYLISDACLLLELAFPCRKRLWPMASS